MGSIYTMIPRPIDEFAGVKALSRYAFGLLWDRWRLSCRPENIERFTDRVGIYCYYDQTAMAAEMGITLPTLRACIKELYTRHLIDKRRVGMGQPIRYYITARAWDFMVNGADDLVWNPFPAGYGLEAIRDPDADQQVKRLKEDAERAANAMQQLAQDIDDLTEQP